MSTIKARDLRAGHVIFIDGDTHTIIDAVEATNVVVVELDARGERITWHLQPDETVQLVTPATTAA